MINMFDKKIVILFFLIFLSTQVFAASPVFTGDITATRQYAVAGDRNYYDFNVQWWSGIVTDADNDMNADTLCQASVNDGMTWFTAIPTVDWNQSVDGNKCYIDLNYEWGNTDESQIKFKVIDSAGNVTTSTDKNWWLDNTAPTTTPNHPSGSPATVILTCEDDATTAGDGVGCKNILYWVDGGAMQTSTDNPTIFDVSGVGSHTIQWCSLDNFDNNECLVSGIWSKSFNVEVSSTGGCDLLNLTPLLIAAILLVAICFVMMSGGANDPRIIITLVIVAIITIVAMMIMGSLLSGFCIV